MVKLDQCSSVLLFKSLQVIYELVNVRVIFQLGMSPFKVVIGSRMNGVMLVPHSYLKQGIGISPGCCHIATLNKESSSTQVVVT